MKTTMIKWTCILMAALLAAGRLEANESGREAKTKEREKQEPSEALPVTFKGKGRARNRDAEVAFEEATRAAKEDALEKATERLLIEVKRTSLRKVAEQYVAKNLTPDKCFKAFEVTSKRRTNSTTYVTGKATLNDTLPRTIAMLRDRFENRGYPRMMVVLDEEVIQPRTFPPIPTGGMTAQIAVEQLLIKEGLTVVDKAQVSENERKAIQAAVMKGDHAAVVALVRKHRANVVFSGPPARAQYFGNVDMGSTAGSWSRYGATVQVRVIDSDIGQLLAAQDCEGRGVGETNIVAASNALKDAGTKMAKKLLDDILWFWFGPDEFIVRVTVRGLSHDKVVDLADAIVEEEDWVKRHGSVEMTEGQCTFALTVADPATSGKVADVLRQMEKGLKVTEVTARRVMLEKPEG